MVGERGGIDVDRPGKVFARILAGCPDVDDDEIVSGIRLNERMGLLWREGYRPGYLLSPAFFSSKAAFRTAGCQHQTGEQKKDHRNPHNLVHADHEEEQACRI